MLQVQSKTSEFEAAEQKDEQKEKREGEDEDLMKMKTKMKQTCQTKGYKRATAVWTQLERVLSLEEQKMMRRSTSIAANTVSTL